MVGVLWDPKGRVATKEKGKDKRAQAHQCHQSCVASGIKLLQVIPCALDSTAKVGAQRRASSPVSVAAKACMYVPNLVAKVSTVCSSIQRSDK